MDKSSDFIDVTRRRFLSTSSMSKRGFGETLLKKQKQKKNGISSSSSVLELTDTSQPWVMQVWHTNVEDPLVFRRSVVPIPSGPQLEGMNTGAKGSYTEADQEDFNVIALAADVVHARPKRKRGNNGVSHCGSNLLIDSCLNFFG